VGLTDKEKQVLELRSKGLIQSDVAERLGISQAAVSDFEKNAKRKIVEAEATIAFARTLHVSTKKGVRK